MASQFNTVGRHQALLAFTRRAGLKAFAMQLGAAVAVVFEQRDGVVDLFLYGERPFAYPTVADGKTRLLEEILFFPHRTHANRAATVLIDFADLGARGDDFSFS